MTAVDRVNAARKAASAVNPQRPCRAKSKARAAAASKSASEYGAPR